MAPHHWAEHYVGKPYVSGAMGPDAFNCWGLACMVEHLHFGRTLPELVIDVDGLTPRQLILLLRDHPGRDGWSEVHIPQDGDLVAMGRLNDEAHIGVWADIDGGAVIHAIAGMGVCKHSRLHIRLMAYNLVRFYRPVAELMACNQERCA